MEEDISSRSSLSGFAAFLAKNHQLDHAVAFETLEEANLNKVSYIETIIKKKLLTPAVAARMVAEYFGLPLCDVRAINPDSIPSDLFNLPQVKRRQSLPLFIKEEVLFLAVADPTIENLYDIRFLTGHEIRLVVTENVQLMQVLDEWQNKLIASEIGSSASDMVETISVVSHQDDSADSGNYDAESAPVINYVNKIIVDAIEKGASDIHFERYENEYRIRYRINGALYPVASPPIKLASFLLARIKIMAMLDITEHRIPQDGRFKLAVSKVKSQDFRVSVCPTLFGEKIVLRLLDSSQVTHSLDELGMSTEQRELLVDALEHTQGMILVTGPTGSGKSVTLYTALSYLNKADDNIMTVEDPVEIPLYGINQVHVNTKVGLTFAAALRSFLRQDPDIIMVGEIRDLETADIAIKAAQTGHLLLSTLHTNSAPETLTRLVNMGIAPYNIASSLLLVIAQRLLRVLCDKCKIKETLPDEILLMEGFKKEEIATLQLYKPGSCSRCTHGYKGRTAIFEMLPITDEIAHLIMSGADSLQIAAASERLGVQSLREAGLEKVRQGTASLSDLNSTFR